jgi:hypothetical protein
MLAFLDRRIDLEPEGVAGESLARFCERAVDLPPRVAEVGIVHLLEAVARPGDDPRRLALVLWGIDLLVTIGSPRAAGWLPVAVGAFEGRVPHPGAWSNLARLATMVGGEAGGGCWKALESRSRTIEVDLDDDLEIALAMAAGALAGDPRLRIEEIGAAFGRFGSLPDRGRSVAAAMGSLAARLDPDRLRRLASRIDSPAARFTFLLGASGDPDRP